VRSAWSEATLCRDAAATGRNEAVVSNDDVTERSRARAAALSSRGGGRWDRYGKGRTGRDNIDHLKLAYWGKADLKF